MLQTQNSKSKGPRAARVLCFRKQRAGATQQLAKGKGQHDAKGFCLCRVQWGIPIHSATLLSLASLLAVCIVCMCMCTDTLMQARNSYWLPVFLQFFEARSLNLMLIHLARPNPPASQVPNTGAVGMDPQLGSGDQNSSPHALPSRHFTTGHHLPAFWVFWFVCFFQTVLLYGATTHMLHHTTHPLETHNTKYLHACSTTTTSSGAWCHLTKKSFTLGSPRSCSVSRDLSTLSPSDTKPYGICSSVTSFSASIFSRPMLCQVSGFHSFLW